jgi:electron transport complex protein RnfC
VESNKIEFDLSVMDQEMPCIRCGACVDVCPAQLQPQRLLQQLRADDFEQAGAEGLFDCSECGRCDIVCPSRIPLLQVLRSGKKLIRQRARQTGAADAARERYLSRLERLRREAIETAVRQSERKAQVASPDAVAAALERAKAKRGAQDKSSDS